MKKLSVVLMGLLVSTIVFASDAKVHYVHERAMMNYLLVSKAYCKFEEADFKYVETMENMNNALAEKEVPKDWQDSADQSIKIVMKLAIDGLGTGGQALCDKFMAEIKQAVLDVEQL